MCQPDLFRSKDEAASAKPVQQDIVIMWSLLSADLSGLMNAHRGIVAVGARSVVTLDDLHRHPSPEAAGWLGVQLLELGSQAGQAAPARLLQDVDSTLIAGCRA